MTIRQFTNVVVAVVCAGLLGMPAFAGDIEVEGFAGMAEIKGGAKEVRDFSYRGMDDGYLVGGDGKQSVTWKTAALPAGAKDGTVTFVFAAVIQGGQPVRGEREIMLGGKHLIKYAVPVTGDAQWQEGGVTLKFDYLQDCLWGGTVKGVMRLTVPVSMLKPGSPAELTEQAAMENSTSFLLNAVTNVLADPNSRPALNPVKIESHKPVTAERLQYNGLGLYQLFDRPNKQQGLSTLLSRGRVRPDELLVVDRKGGTTLGSDRTIFFDEYTGSEVWRITNFPGGVVRHMYSSMPAWNANGRLIELFAPNGLTLLFNQETCTMLQPNPNVRGQWSTTEPDVIFDQVSWEGKPAVAAIDIVNNKPLRPLGPVRQYAGISPISADGKWVCWREGIQDDGTSIGLGASDGSRYRGISLAGGLIDQRQPVELAAALPGQPDVNSIPGGIHQMYFTRRPDGSIMANIKSAKKVFDRIYSQDGKILVEIFPHLSHVSWHPEGKFVIFFQAGLGGMDPFSGAKWNILEVRDATESHSSWNSYDPDWAACSYRTKFAGEIIRVSMRDDRSVARLCGTCPLNPDTTAYDNDEFACVSPDGTKVLFMSTMSGSVNEYIVVAANPRAPRLTGRWTDDGYQLTVAPDQLSREIKGYRIYRTGVSGQEYREVATIFPPTGQEVGRPEKTVYTIKDVRKGDGAFFAVRAQEWSGLLSRYSNEVSADGKPTARYIEAEAGAFTNFKQGYDAKDAGDMYYLFVPMAGLKCSVVADIGTEPTDVWARVAGRDAEFTANAGGDTIFVGKKKSYDGWTWVKLGRFSGRLTVESQSEDFRLDRLYLAVGDKTPAGIGGDYAADTTFAAQVVTGVEAKSLTPFAAEVTWKPLAGARYYNVYASPTPDFAPSQAKLLYSPPAGTERIVDWGLTPGTKWHYKVLAVDFDGIATTASQAVSVTMPTLTINTLKLQYASGTLAKETQVDNESQGAKSILLEKGRPYELTFDVPADGDYVIWHEFRADHGAVVRFNVKLDGQPYVMNAAYDQASLYGKTTTRNWVWSRYRFLWGRNDNAVLNLKAGRHTLNIEVDRPIRLKELIVTNDQSLIPKGRLNTF